MKDREPKPINLSLRDEFVRIEASVAKRTRRFLNPYEEHKFLATFAHTDPPPGYFNNIKSERIEGKKAKRRSEKGVIRLKSLLEKDDAQAMIESLEPFEGIAVLTPLQSHAQQPEIRNSLNLIRIAVKDIRQTRSADTTDGNNSKSVKEGLELFWAVISFAQLFITNHKEIMKHEEHRQRIIRESVLRYGLQVLNVEGLHDTAEDLVNQKAAQLHLHRRN